VKKFKWLIRPSTLAIIGFLLAVTSVGVVRSAYHHEGQDDAALFLQVYPSMAGTKLDNCNLCHTGGKTGSKNVGSCQYCHDVTQYGTKLPAEYRSTLNSYGLDYMQAGRNAAAVQAIESLDSDGDGYSNKTEILANRYPGNAQDDPTKVPAPSRVYTRAQLEKMPQHTQFMLMNTTKSGDFYVEYSGVTLESLLKKLLLPSATAIRAISPDGFAQFHPLNPDSNPAYYHIFGTYPPATFWYNPEADTALNPCGWCDYKAPSAAGRTHGDPIYNRQGLKTILAIKRDGQYLTPGVLTPANKLDGEGPFRVVPPQKIPGPPDQQNPIQVAGCVKTNLWPFDPNGDRNAGYSARTVTIIKVEPLPEGTTDVNTLEAGWPYADDQNPRIMIYGAIDPVPTIKEKLAGLSSTLWHSKMNSFTHWGYRSALATRVNLVQKWVMLGWYSKAYNDLKGHVLIRTDGCTSAGAVDKDDWVADCEFQKQLYWSVNEILVLLDIVN
jgi:hypothetical protein